MQQISESMTAGFLEIFEKEKIKPEPNDARREFARRQAIMACHAGDYAERLEKQAAKLARRALVAGHE